MVFSSDKQRKAVMAKLNQGGTRSDVKPVLLKKAIVVSGTKPMFRKDIRTRKIVRLTQTEREFIGKNIRKNIQEGKPRKQAIAIGFSQARAKFGKSRIPEVKNQKTDNIDKRTRNLLITLLGFSIALSILRGIRKR